MKRSTKQGDIIYKVSTTHTSNLNFEITDVCVSNIGEGGIIGF